MAQDDITASQRIDARIAELDDWRGETLANIRAVLKRADPDLVEEWKWRCDPVQRPNGIVYEFGRRSGMPMPASN